MTVFIVQLTHYWDGAALVPRDVSSAAQFGRLVHLLSPTASPFQPAQPIKELREKLLHFSDNDYLLLMGSPVFIGLAVGIAADYNDGRVKLLQWSGKGQNPGYTVIEADLQYEYAEEFAAHA